MDTHEPMVDRVRLPQGLMRRVRRDARRLEAIVGSCMPKGIMAGVEAKVYDLGCGVETGPERALRRPNETELHAVETWYTMSFDIDCRGDIFAQAADKARKFGAGLIAAADKLDAQSKRRSTPRLGS